MQKETHTDELTVDHHINHQEMLLSKIPKTEHVITTVTPTVNVIRGNGLNHQQFWSFPEEIHSEFGDLQTVKTCLPFS